jgi:uncharacterized repeat protein (TIGR03803 family)
MKERNMQSAKKSRFKMSNLAAAAVRGAFAIAVLSALLVAARPAQAQTENVIWNFTGSPDGASPYSSVTLNDGNFYGTSYLGGLNNDGAVYEVSPNGTGGYTEQVIYNFCSETNCADGENPSFANLVFDSNGNIYGSTYNGGANGDGVVFKLTPSGGAWVETVLYSFAGSPDAANPIAGLIWDASGNLYGTSYNGGTNNIGTVWELSPNGSGGWTETVVASLSEIDAGLTINSAGDIFGTTNNTVFELTPNGTGGYNAAKTLSTFSSSGAKGTGPEGTLVIDGSGNLYGTTRAGGKYANGTVYKLTLGAKGTYTESILCSFDTAGVTPYGGVILDGSGNLYGATKLGGKNSNGMVYELVAPKYTQKVLMALNGENGSEPVDSLLLSGGYLYGTTSDGGSDGNGAVFVVNPAAAVTTTALTSSANPSTSGEAVTFTATVTPAPPNGEVVVFEPLGQSPMTGGVATFTTSSLKVGTTNIRAVYGGDLNFLTSMSAWTPQVVDK